MIRELNEELAKLIMRQISNPNDTSDDKHPRSPARKIKDLTQDINVNKRVLELQNQELSKLQSKVDKLGNAAYFMSLNDKVLQIKQKTKQLKLEKRRKETDFKKDLYQDKGRYFYGGAYRDEEMLNKDYLDKKMKFARMKNEAEKLEIQNLEAVQFISEQKNHMEGLQHKSNKLVQLADHYNIRINNQFPSEGDTPEESARKKELRHRFEILKTYVPTLERNSLFQNEATKKDLHILREAFKHETVVLSELKVQRDAIEKEIKSLINRKDLNNQTLLKMKKIMQNTKKKEDEDAFYEEILDFGLERDEDDSSIVEARNKKPVKSKRQITLEIAQLATGKRVEKKKSVHKMKALESSPSNDRSFSRNDISNTTTRTQSRERERVQLVRQNGKPKHKGTEKEQEFKMKINNAILESQQPLTKPNLGVKKAPIQKDAQEIQMTFNSEKNVTEPHEVSRYEKTTQNSPGFKPLTNNTELLEGVLDNENKSNILEKQRNHQISKQEKNEIAEPKPSPKNTTEKENQHNEKVEKDDPAKSEAETNKNVFKKPAFTLRGRGKVAENSQRDQTPQNENNNSEIKPTKPIENSIITSPNKNIDTKNEQNPEITGLQDKPLGLINHRTKPLNSEKDNLDSKQGGLTLNFNATDSKKQTANDNHQPESSNSQPLALNLGSNSRLKTLAKASDAHTSNNSYLQMLSNDTQKDNTTKQLILPHNLEASKDKEISTHSTIKQIVDNSKPFSLTIDETPTIKKNEETKVVTPKTTIKQFEENAAPFGFISNSNEKSTTKNKEEPLVQTKNPNPFSFQSQQPVRLNLANPNGGVGGLKFRQNDFAKPLESDKSFKNSDIVSLDLASQKQSPKLDETKGDIIDFDLDFSKNDHNNAKKPLNHDSKLDSKGITDPFADAGNLNKINFGEKKGLFDTKKEESVKKEGLNDPAWLKSSIEGSKAKANENSEYSWLKTSGLKDSDTDKVFKFGEEENKLGLNKPTKTSELSFLNNSKADNSREISEDSSNLLSKKPRMKISATKKPAVKIIHIFYGLIVFFRRI